MLPNIFLAGYTDFITKEFLTTAFPKSRIVIAGGCSVKESGRISRFRGELTDSSCRDLFHSYEFTYVLYFSQGLAPLGRTAGDELNILVNLITDSCPETRLLYLSGPEHQDPSPLYLREISLREMCRRLAVKAGSIQFLVCPWIYQIHPVNSPLSELLCPIVHKLALPENQEVRFLAAEDLAILLNRMLEDWEGSPEPFYLPAGTQCSLKALTQWVQAAVGEPSPEFQFSAIPPEALRPGNDPRLRTRYLWAPVYTLEKDLDAIAEQCQTRHVRKAYSLPSHTSLLMRLLELLAAGVLCELLLKLSSVSIQFQMIDFRLLTIVILGSMYNIPIGIAAALMESLSLIWAYTRSGTSWLTLFYEPTNWLPFIAFFTVGSVCGYLRSRDRSLLKFVREENQSLKERYAYLRKVNDDILREKQEYKQQIIGSRDSFGKLFSIAQQLNQSHPKHLLSKAVDVMESIMGSSTVAIYTCGSQQPYGRMSVASRNIALPYSLQMDRYYARLEPLADGEAWVNRSLEPDMPQYLFGIYKDGKITLVLLIQKTDYNQMSLYHENIFRIVCGLISNALIRAMEYQDAVHLSHCVEGSHRVLRQPYFLEELEYAVSAAEQNQAVYLLLRLDTTDSPPELEGKLEGCIRATDTIGHIGQRWYVLLLQAKLEDFPIIRNRFAAAGLPCQLVSREQQRNFLKKEEAI